jgi:hypothetical protein
MACGARPHPDAFLTTVAYHVATVSSKEKIIVLGSCQERRVYSTTLPPAAEPQPKPKFEEGFTTETTEVTENRRRKELGLAGARRA